MIGVIKRYIIKDKKNANTYLSYVRNDGVVHSGWIKTEWMDCCKMYQSKAHAKKVARMVDGEVWLVRYNIDDLGVVPFSAKIIGKIA